MRSMIAHMTIDVPAGFNCRRFGGDCIVPGTRIHLRRDTDNKAFTGTVHEDGSLQLSED
jgi:hypothetical protein